MASGAALVTVAGSGRISLLRQENRLKSTTR
jgi:hypothetical protein